MDQLSRLRDWYAAQCDGDWEHSYGIKLETLDNPGWLIYIDLADTELQDKPFTPVHRGDSDADANWLHCKVKSGKFEAAGGVPNLPDMLEAFLSWAGY
ncbi:immunity 53 family protein [Luteimonas sp. MC1828]|uniref:immunity 53 family protein n=1 Tax=Luteimonas sp. MC1828 TaxID=2799787 RepID=UPI001F3F7674|nr:immunity 53 family protein [Luteimonas sp. MC1828]